MFATKITDAVKTVVLLIIPRSYCGGGGEATAWLGYFYIMSGFLWQNNVFINFG